MSRAIGLLRGTPLDVLSDAIKAASETGHVIECGPVSIETNGRVVFYFIGDNQVTAAQALEAMEGEG